MAKGQLSAVTHGGYSAAYRAPLVASMKRSLLARMGIRQRDLTWAGRELLDSYVRAKAKVVAIDNWFEVNPMIDQEGKPAAVLSVYFTALASSVRTLEALRLLIADLGRGDRDFAAAIAALDVESKR